MCQSVSYKHKLTRLMEFTHRTSQVRVASQVRVTSQVRVRSQFFFSVFFFVDYTNDVRAVIRKINFPVVDIFHSRSKEPLPLRIAVTSARYRTTFNINSFSKNTKAYNLHMAEEHVPYSCYTGKTDGEGSRSQEYLTFAREKINTIDSISSPVSIKQGLRTTEYGIRNTEYGIRTSDYGVRTT